jgi:hypothetical protein
MAAEMARCGARPCAARVNAELAQCSLGRHMQGGLLWYRPAAVPGIDQIAEVAT